MAQTIQLRRDTLNNWTTANPILAQSELGVEINTLKLKIGDGVTNWNALSYYSSSEQGGIKWDVLIPYNSGDIVSYLGNIYIVGDIQPPVGTLPTDPLFDAVGGYTVKNITAHNTLTTDLIVSAVTTNGGPITTGTTLYTLTLPAAPEDEDIIQIMDGTGNSQDEPILILRAGTTPASINNLTEDLTIDVNFFDIKLIYNSANNNWALGGK